MANTKELSEIRLFATRLFEAIESDEINGLRETEETIKSIEEDIEKVMNLRNTACALYGEAKRIASLYEELDEQRKVLKYQKSLIRHLKQHAVRIQTEMGNEF